MRFFTSLIVSLLMVLPCAAQVGRFFDADRWLTNSFVNRVFQDRDGFIWIATRNGLMRYDGYQFTPIHRDATGDTPSNNYITAIVQDAEGTFYFGTNEGVLQYKNGRFDDITFYNQLGQKAKSYISDITVTHDGRVLIGTAGFGVLEVNRQTLEALPVVGLAVHFIRQVFEDSRHRLWVLTTNRGVYQNADGRGWKKVDDRIYNEMVEDRQGNIFLGTHLEGLYMLRRGTREVRLIEGTMGYPAMVLAANSHGEVVVGSDGGGLMAYHPATGRIDRMPLVVSEMDMSRAKVHSVLEDRDGNMWYGMPQKGVYMQSAHRSGFKSMGALQGSNSVIGQATVQAVVRDRHGRLWVGTDGQGLYLLSPQMGLIRHYTSTPSVIMNLAEDEEGRIWLGCYERGFGWVSADADAYHSVDVKLNEHLSAFGLAPDGKGNIWVATMGDGLLRYTPKTQAVKQYKMSDGADLDKKKNALPNNYLNKVVFSRDGKRIYVCSSVGLFCLDLASQSWTKYMGVNQLDFSFNLRALMEDSMGRLWMGTFNGLLVYEPKTRKLRRLTTADGLPDNGIASIACDGQGSLWVGTDHGLCRLSPEGKVMATYSTGNGLAGNEFSEAAVFAAGDMMYFGGTKGLTWFSPRQILTTPQPMRVQIIALGIGAQEVMLPAEATSYKLAYEDNSFTIKLSTLTYEATDNIVFQYRIDGDEWRSISRGTNEIAFSHQPWGTYKLEIRAELNNLVSPVKTFTLTVSPPWYASVWAWIVYVLLLCTAVYMVVRYNQRRQHARLRLQEHIHAEEMSNARLRFFMNMGHEIRTPMTLIITPLLSLLKEDVEPARHRMYELIHRNAERVIHTVNQMMDLNKIDKGQMRMRMQPTDMVSFIDDERHLFEAQAKAKNIELVFEHDSDRLEAWIDPMNFDKIVVNLLSNAFKFTQTGGKVSLLLSHNAHDLTLTVRDTGSGIAPDQLTRIFERFYQVPGKGSAAGTGIGLDLTQALVSLHHGTITARNHEEPHGAEFEVTIPLGNSHLSAEEMAVEEQTAADDHDAQPAILPDVKDVVPDEPAEQRKKRLVAVVEDDIDISSFLAQELSADYQVATFANGAEALPQIIRQQPDLVISDVMMPEMDGYTLCNHLKSNINTNAIPIILLTAKSLDEDQIEGLAMGADAFIVKPFNLDILKRTAANLIATRRLMQKKYTGEETQEDKVEEITLQSGDEKLLTRLMAEINKNLDNSEFNIDTLAQQVGISRVHLYRKMKELTGQSPHNFIRNLRLKQAVNLLTNKSLTVSEVAYSCGFATVSTFSTLFKKFYGCTPTEYVKEHASMPADSETTRQKSEAQ